jgi:hypothetical protein
MRPLLPLLLLAACANASAPATFAPVVVETRAIPFDASDAASTGAAPLRFMGGIELRARDDWFGGWSALRCPDRCYAVGDAGAVLRFDLVENGDRLVGIANVEAAAQLDAAGSAGAKQTRDAEALIISPGGSEALVAYEGSNSFWVVPLDRDRWQAKQGYRLPEMADWAKNGGPETLVLLPSGRPLVIAEQGDGVRVPAIIVGGNPGGNATFHYVPPARFAPTDAVVDGDRLIILNRAFSALAGVAVALTEVPIAALVDGATVTGSELVRLRPPVNVDNMEGIELRRADGRTFLYLLSDDNFNDAQRTLLLKFELRVQPIP